MSTGALIAASAAFQGGPGEAHPGQLLLVVGALLLGLGSQGARGLILREGKLGAIPLLALGGFALFTLWASGGGVPFLSGRPLATLLRLGAWAAIGCCWSTLAPPAGATARWQPVWVLLGAALGAFFPTAAFLIAVILGLYRGFSIGIPRQSATSSTWVCFALSAVAGFLAGGLWMASRTSLDASGGGFIVSGVLFYTLFFLSRTPKLKGARLFILLGLFLILSLLSLGLIPLLATQVLHPNTPLFPKTTLLQAALMLGPALFLRAALGQDLRGALGQDRPQMTGLGAGILLASVAGGQVFYSTLLVTALFGLGCVLAAHRLSDRAAGLALIFLAAVAGPDSNPGRALGLQASWNQSALSLDLLTQNQSTKIFQRRQRFLQNRTLIESGFGPHGSFAIFKPERGPAELALDGILHQMESRSADTQRLLPHLAAALHPAPLNALVLGDPLGLMTESLAVQEIDRIHVTVPQPTALRAFVNAEPGLADILLGATVKLIPDTPSAALQNAPPIDLLIEMAHSPWADAHQGLPRKTDLKKRNARLSDSGVYALGVDLHWLTEQDLKGLISDFESVFSYAWAFLPPKGADQLILCGWESPQEREWDRFIQVLQRGKGALAALDIRSPLDLADRALGNSHDLAQIGGPSQPRRWMGNLSALSPPLLPLFRNHIHPEDLFPANLELAAILQERGHATSAFLQLLSDNAHGNLEAVFKTSRSLLATESGKRSLDPLVAPYLEAARAAIAKGRSQGTLTTAWDNARTNLTAALLLNPNSAEAHALLGEAHLATGRLSPATQSFLRALELQPGQRDPLLGLGQIALQRNDLPSAEAHLREAHLAHPKDWLPAYNLGAFLMDRGLDKEAESVLRKAAAWAENEHAAPHTALAQLFLSRGQATAALLEAHRALGIEKNAMNAYVLGKAYFEVEQPDSATQYFQRAILADPGFWQARAGMGILYAESGDWQRCVDAFDRVLQVAPTNRAAQENHGRCLAQVEP
jgi:tetratricopeptide (TPR) repeat protein